MVTINDWQKARRFLRFMARIGDRVVVKCSDSEYKKGVIVPRISENSFMVEQEYLQIARNLDLGMKLRPFAWMVWLDEAITPTAIFPKNIRICLPGHS